MNGGEPPINSTHTMHCTVSHSQCHVHNKPYGQSLPRPHTHNKLHGQSFPRHEVPIVAVVQVISAALPRWKTTFMYIIHQGTCMCAESVQRNVATSHYCPDSLLLFWQHMQLRDKKCNSIDNGWIHLALTRCLFSAVRGDVFAYMVELRGA